MADDKRKKCKAAKSAIMINLSNLSNALSDDATVSMMPSELAVLNI